jgi:SAM-dependent methyltransferase
MACAHSFLWSEARGYRRCVLCGSYHAPGTPPPETVYGAGYWSHDQGRSTLQEQVHNVDSHLERGVSKCQFVLDRITVEDREAALEIGCAPGRLLLHLRGIGRFRRVVGVEADPGMEEEIRQIGCHGGELVFGLFPEATRALEAGAFTLIVALDLFEHIHDPAAFLAECARLLRPGGQLLMMCPLVLADMPLPAHAFNPTEHVWLHSEAHLRELLGDAGFAGVTLDRWCPGHEFASAVRGDGGPLA